jgi:mannose-6-phosphate isomerase-like protein (cupin superfamily)
MKPLLRRSREAEEYFFHEGCHILEVWNRDEDPAVSIARARVPPGGTTRLHRLIETAERYLVLAGEGRAQIDGRPAQVVGPGDLVYIPPGCTQRISNTGADDLVFLAVCTPRFVSERYVDLGS